MAVPANALVYTGLGDETTAEAMSAEMLLLLADRQALPMHPALVYAGDISGGSSRVLKVPIMGLNGYNLLASTTDGDVAANTALTDASATLTVGRFTKWYEQSDLTRMTAGKYLNPAVWAADAVLSQALTLTSLLAALCAGFATVVGVSGVNASLQNFLDAKTSLAVASVEGPYIALLHSIQWGDLEGDLALNAGGSVQFDPATAAATKLLGTGYKGQLFGVDVFVSNYIPTANAGADRAGGMFGRGAMLWADGTIPAVEGDPFSANIGSKVLFERDRNRRYGSTGFGATAYMGVSEGIDLAGVAIVTDA